MSDHEKAIRFNLTPPPQLEIVSLRLYLFLFNKEETLRARTYIFPQEDLSINRLFEQNLYSRFTVPQGQSLVVADLSYPYESDSQTTTIRSLPATSEIHKQLIDCAILPKDGLLKSGYVDVPYAYLRPSQSNTIEIFRMKREIHKIRNMYLLGRFGAGVYNNADFAILSGFDIARKLLMNGQKTINSDEDWNNHHNVFG